jgi:hypothetical protein
MTKEEFLEPFSSDRWPVGGEIFLQKFKDFAEKIYEDIPPEDDFHAVIQPLKMSLFQMYRVNRIRGF